ncbi:hypothetical protein Tco_0772686 [Tanacetum coccineum]|uniref:Transposase (putative) gypsy type domain-containing protein n=1 Tax=Tanacetum coccineum TaxID=301880 RepID=A0ABQ4ZJH5_9ASTR
MGLGCGCGCGACREAVLWAAIPSRVSRFHVIVLTMEDDDVMDEEHQWRGNWNVAKCVAAAIKRQNHLDDQIYNQLVEKAKEQGYDVTKLKKTTHTNPPPETEDAPADTNVMVLDALQERGFVNRVVTDGMEACCLPFGSLKMFDVEQADMGSQAEASSSSKRDMSSYISTMKPSDVKALTRKYKIPRDLHPVAVSSEWTMDRLTDEYIGLYEQYFEFVGLRVPFSTFLLAVIRHFHVHISQLVPLGLTRLTLFELYCRSLNIVPSVTLFRVFYKLSKQGDWFSFEKRAGKDFRGKILNETFSCMKKWKGRFFFIDRRAIPDAMCWRHHDSDISDPAPKDGFDEADVITLTHQPIDIRGIPSGLLFSAGLAITWEFPKFRPLFKDPEGHVVTMSEYLRLPFLSGMTIEAGEALTEQDVIPQHTTTPFSDDEQVPGKTDSQQRVEASDPKIVATRIRKAHAAAKRKAEKHRESEGAGGFKGSSKRCKDKPSDHIPCPTPLRTMEAVTSDVSRGENVVSPTQAQGDNLLEILAHDSTNTTTRPCEEHHNKHSGVLGNRYGSFDDDVDEEVELEGPDRHVSDTTERVVIGTESIPTAATRPDNGKSVAQEETPMLDPLSKGVWCFTGAGADEAGSSLPPSLFVPTWGIHQRSRVTTPEECRDLMVNLIPPGVQEEMHLLDNNVVLDRAWFSLARGAMAQTHALQDFNVVQNFNNTLSKRHRKLREEHAQCSEGLAVVRAEKDSLMAINAEQALRIKELEQQLKSADEVRSSAVKDLESQLAQKDSALVYAERIFGERHSENEELRAQLAFAQRRRPMLLGSFFPLWWSASYRAMNKNKVFPFLSTMSSRLDGGKMNAEYERLFSKTYSYVDRISHLSEKPVQDLLKLHPAPPPRDAPKAGSGGIVFAPRLVRAAEVARSKDTTSLQDPTSKNASKGSKAPPSKKT